MNPFQAKTILRPVLLVLLAAVAPAQTIWYVDDDGPGDPAPGLSIPGNPAYSDPFEDGTAAHPFDDIYKAIDAATNGDEILVLPSNAVGAYALASTLSFDGKDLTLRSTGGAAVTTLTGTFFGYGVLINGDATIEGFTFNGFDHGTSGAAGATYVYLSTVTIRDCVFTNCNAYLGGGIYTYWSTLLVEDCVFLGNSVAHQGGAIYVSAGDNTIRRCTFEDNDAGYGGAVLIRTVNAASSFTRIEDSLFRANRSTLAYTGGLAKFDSGDVLVDRCRFLGNEAIDEGSALLISGRGTVRNTLFDGNLSPTGDGTISVRSGADARIESCTLLENLGGGVLGSTSATTDVRNTILWGNGVELTDVTSVSYSNVLGGAAGEGNLDVLPLFVDRDGEDGIAGTLDDDLSLDASSPCIDAGDTFDLAAPFDLTGNARAVDLKSAPNTGTTVLGNTIDIGCHEFVRGCGPREGIAPGLRGSRSAPSGPAR